MLQWTLKCLYFFLFWIMGFFPPLFEYIYTEVKMLAHIITLGLPRWLSGKESTCRICRRYGFDLWVRKITWRRKWQPTPVVLSGESHGQKGLVGYKSTGLQRIGYDWVTEHAFIATLFLVLEEPSQSLPLQLQQSRISPRVYEDSLFLTSSPALVICYILMIIVLTGVRGYHIVVLMCILPMISDVDHLSTCLNHLYIFGTVSVQVLCPFYKSGCFWCRVVWVLCISWLLTSYLTYHLQTSSPIAGHFLFYAKVFGLIYHHLLILLLLSWPEETYLKYIANSSVKKHPVYIFICFMFLALALKF